jgi:hypothetical protein
MASGWKGIATGALALIALETVLQPKASGQLSGLLSLPAAWANRFLDPSVPALHKGGGGAAPAPKGAPIPWSDAGGFTPNPRSVGGDWTGPTPAPRAPHRQGLPTN